MRYATVAFVVTLLFASFAYAEKLAPSQNTLQPIPANAHPAVSESVQRAASQTDLRTIENVQTAEQNSGSAQDQPAASPVIPSAPATSSDTFVLVIVLVIAAFVAGGIAWLWRSF